MMRMVKEYTTRFYVPQIQHGMQIERNRYDQARALAAWKEKVRTAWSGLQLYVDGRRDGQLSLGERVDVNAWVRADQLRPEDIAVELVHGEASNEQIVVQQALPMKYIRQENDGSYRYEASLQPDESGSIAYGVRVLPNHPALAGKHEMGLIRWA
jgi:glycogen phosphorylase